MRFKLFFLKRRLGDIKGRKVGAGCDELPPRKPLQHNVPVMHASAYVSIRQRCNELTPRTPLQRNVPAISSNIEEYQVI
jgi:hypothetical protein